MAKFNLKSIFSAPLIIFSPLKKLKINGFVGGLIFGAIFSLVVNMVTVQIQEMIQKQRILEAVEFEILNNSLLADQIFEQNTKDINAKKEFDDFHPFYRYSDDLWRQSSEPLQYIAQLDPEVQTDIVLYYSISVKSINNMIEKYEQIANKKFDECYDYVNSNNNSNERDECQRWNEMILKWEAESADMMANYGSKVLKNFHPTKDRINSFLIKFFMGDNAVNILLGTIN